jgi:hypothetical protein
VSTAVDTLVAAELRFQQQLMPELGLEGDEERLLLEQLAVGRILQGQWQGFGSYENWNDIRSRYLIPRSQAAVRFLSNRPNLPPEMAEWFGTYVDAVDNATAVVSAFYQEIGVVGRLFEPVGYSRPSFHGWRLFCTRRHAPAGLCD